MIDEKKLIETINKRIKYWDAKTDEYTLKADERNMTSCNGTAIGLRMAIETIESQPEAGEWIPASKRLPEYDKYVLISCQSKFGNYVTTAKLHHGKWKKTNNEGVYDYFDKEVTAWQPLPKPYGGKEK